MVLLIDKPMPMFEALVLNRLSNIRCEMLLSIPGPVSETLAVKLL
jgi:hypothetical protein